MKITLAFLMFAIFFNMGFQSNKTMEGELNKEINLKCGQEISIKAESLKISFNKVGEDSRCPAGTNCIWAGNGKITITVSKLNKEQKVLELNTTVEPKSGLYDDYEIKLMKLSPYP